jgi:lipopolysaccharide export system protein LptA
MRKSFLVAFFVMLVSGIQCIYAQSVANKVLSSLQFEAPKNLYHAKGNVANMRKRPNVKADWVQVIERGRLVEDLGANPNWITAKVDGESIHFSIYRS